MLHHKPEVTPVPHRRLVAGFAAGVLFLALAAPLAAQPPPGPEEEDPAAYGDDPGTGTDPAVPSEKWTLGDEMLPFDGDPLSLDSTDLYPPELLGTPPSYPDDLAFLTTSCADRAAPVVPLLIAPATTALPNASRYFSFRTTPMALFGVSADNGCHLDLPADVCHYGPNDAYKATIQAAKNAKLNKLRLWVAIIGEKNPSNVPFLQATDASGTFWNLLEPNPDYFLRLYNVVAFAKSLDMIVEVTFFAPFEGKFFSEGPWGGKGKLPKAQGGFEAVKFSLQEYFVIHDPRTTADAVMNEKMRPAQAKIVEWTVKTLWCFDNVYWEIANEPELDTVDPLEVAKWQNEIPPLITQEERKHPLLAQRGHLVAVQPFTREGTDQYRSNPNIDVINGHYTVVGTDPKLTLPNNKSKQLDAGALRLAQTYGSTQKPFGFNESKITPLPGQTGTRSHLNGALTWALPEPARAEAWEFMFDLGGTYDHYGYLAGANANTPGQIRTQIGKLREFFDGLPLGNLISARSPVWININRYPSSIEGLDTERLAQRFWAVLQTPPTASSRLFLLYLHHSTPRCVKMNAQGPGTQEVEFTSQGCPQDPRANNQRRLMSRQGYDARIWNVPATMKYQDTLRLLDLGPNNGNFDLQWITPATLSKTPTQTIAWNAQNKTCNGGSCQIISPAYAFDIVLQVKQK